MIVPRLSVIIPIYNAEKYIAKCLDSIVSQSLKDIEIICIDDGSSDNSYKILQQHSKLDNRIKIISRKNKGVAFSRNQGIDKSTGKFICFIDADDYYPSDDVLETIYNTAIKNNVLICGGEISYLCNDTIKDAPEYYFEKSGMIDFFDYQFDFGFWRFIYNRDFIVSNNIYFPLYSNFEDPVFFVKAMILAERFYAIKKNVYVYRIGHKNTNLNKQETIDFLNGIKDILILSNKYKLQKLHLLTSNRLLKNWIQDFSVQYKNDEDIVCRYEKTKSKIIMSMPIIIIFIKLHLINLMRHLFSIKNERRNGIKIKKLHILGLSFIIKKRK